MDDNRPLLLLSSCLWIAADLYYVLDTLSDKSGRFSGDARPIGPR